MLEPNKIKYYNGYGGIGGNRKLIPDEITICGITYKIEVTAIENNKEIAKIYQDFFPYDKVIVTDAHQYLLDHYKEFDFIWSSPPCPTHSRIRKVTEHQNKPVYPDMSLYQEILFLEGYFKGKWVVENVFSWYEPLKKPFMFRSHYYWANFVISGKDSELRNHTKTIKVLQKEKGVDLSRYKGIDKLKILRNCVEPKSGLHIFKEAFKVRQETLK